MECNVCFENQVKIKNNCGCSFKTCPSCINHLTVKNCPHCKKHLMSRRYRLKQFLRKKELIWKELKKESI